MNNVFYPLFSKSLANSRKQKYSLKNKHSKTQRRKQKQDRISSLSWVKSTNRLKGRIGTSPMKGQQLTYRPIDDKNQLQESRKCCAFFENRSQRLDFSNARSINIRNHQKQNFDYEFMKSTAQNLNSFNLISKQAGHHQDYIGPFSTSLAFIVKNDELALNQQSTFASNNFIRVYTQNNPNSDNTDSVLQDNSNRVKEKLSLSQNYKAIHSNKSKICACLKYSDLKLPVKLGKQKPVANIYETSRMMYQPSEANLGKTLCSCFGKDNEGCLCQPKCRWMTKWLNMIKNESLQCQQEINQISLQKIIQQIEKDTSRTHSTSPTFQNPRYRSDLKQILVGYCKLDWEVGYVQGMNLIAASIVYHSTTVHDSLRVMSLLMKNHSLRNIYINDLSYGFEMSKRLVLQLRDLSFDLYNYLIEQSVQLQLFVTSWYLSLLGSFVPLTEMHLIIDTFLLYGFKGINQIIITMLIYMREELLMKQEEQLILCFSTQEMSRRAAEINWKELVNRSNFIELDQFQF